MITTIDEEISGSNSVHEFCERLMHRSFGRAKYANGIDRSRIRLPYPICALLCEKQKCDLTLLGSHLFRIRNTGELLFFEHRSIEDAGGGNHGSCKASSTGFIDAGNYRSTHDGGIERSNSFAISPSFH